jgi:predicted alpha/beta hydrolase family esterase
LDVRRSDWIARLKMLLAVMSSGRSLAVLVAHSLGCQHVVTNKKHSRNTHRVKHVCWSRRPMSSATTCASLLPSWSLAFDNVQNNTARQTSFAAPRVPVVCSSV